MYNISKIPTVFINPRTINQIIEPLLADFHKAPSFQAKDHIIITANRKGLIPKSPKELKLNMNLIEGCCLKSFLFTGYWLLTILEKVIKLN